MHRNNFCIVQNKINIVLHFSEYTVAKYYAVLAVINFNLRTWISVWSRKPREPM